MSKIKNLLETISWKTRSLNFKYTGSTLLLNEGGNTWGFKVCTITNNYREYSLLSFECRFPNKTNVQSFTVDHWDVLFTRRWLWNMYEELDDRDMWSLYRGISTWDTFKLSILRKIFN